MVTRLTLLLTSSLLYLLLGMETMCPGLEKVLQVSAARESQDCDYRQSATQTRFPIKPLTNKKTDSSKRWVKTKIKTAGEERRRLTDSSEAGLS